MTDKKNKNITSFMDNGGWWKWTKWAFGYLVTVVLVLAIYSQVIQTRFECVMFSMAALIYIELIGQYSAWGIELLTERDHRNEIHKSLSERVGSPLDADMNEAIQELSALTEKARTHQRINVIARALLWLIIVWNLFKAAFFWPVL